MTEQPRLDETQITALYADHWARLIRVLSRLSGDPDLAADVVQEAFVKLHQRGSLPDAPGGWLVSVALNLLRNAKRGTARHLTLLSMENAAQLHAAPPPAADEAMEAQETGGRVRRALHCMSERERHLLLLRAEGYSYREVADALQLNERSIGTLLARAKSAFRLHYAEDSHAS